MQSIVHWRLVRWLLSTPYYQVLFGRCTNSLSKKHAYTYKSHY
jgi:hypothetical protein